MTSSRRTVWSHRVFIALFVLSLVPLAHAQSLTPHKFTFDTKTLKEKPSTVALAGSLNGWSAVATPISDSDGDGG